MNKFFYDSRQHAAKKMTANGVPCAWVRVFQRQDEHKIIDCGQGCHTVKGATETFGSIAFSCQQLVALDRRQEFLPEAFKIEVCPEVGVEFQVVNCYVGNRYDDYCAGNIIFDFVAEKIIFDGELSMVMANNGVVGQITNFVPTDKRVAPIYELRTEGVRERAKDEEKARTHHDKNELRVPRDIFDYTTCNCDQALTYLAIVDAMVQWRLQSDEPWVKKETELFTMAEKMIREFLDDYPGITLSDYLTRLEE